jgi:hypothetical protein
LGDKDKLKAISINDGTILKWLCLLSIKGTRFL